MFTFFFKKPVVHIDAFSFFKGITDLFPIEDAEKFTPSWFKAVPGTTKSPSGSTVATIRTCPGVVEIFKEGIIIPNWCDLYIDWSKPNLYWEPDEMGQSHPDWQWNSSQTFKEYHHLKIGSPWKFREKTGSKFMFTNPFWNVPTLKYFTPNGITEYKYQNSTNINLWIPKNGFPKNLTINAGTPLAQIVSLENKKIKVHMHEVSKEEWDDDNLSYMFSQAGQYYKRKKILESKCPYHKKDK